MIPAGCLYFIRYIGLRMNKYKIMFAYNYVREDL